MYFFFLVGLLWVFCFALGVGDVVMVDVSFVFLGLWFKLRR